MQSDLLCIIAKNNVKAADKLVFYGTLPLLLILIESILFLIKLHHFV